MKGSLVEEFCGVSSRCPYFEWRLMQEISYGRFTRLVFLMNGSQVENTLWVFSPASLSDERQSFTIPAF
jgi:hypothetical protein